MFSAHTKTKSLRQRPHYAEEIENTASFLRLGLPSTLIRYEIGAFLKRSSNPPDKFENVALFSRLGLPSTLIRPENGALEKNALQAGGIWKRLLCLLVWTEKI